MGVVDRQSGECFGRGAWGRVQGWAADGRQTDGRRMVDGRQTAGKRQKKTCCTLVLRARRAAKQETPQSQRPGPRELAARYYGVRWTDSSRRERVQVQAQAQALRAVTLHAGPKRRDPRHHDAVERDPVSLGIAYAVEQVLDGPSASVRRDGLAKVAQRPPDFPRHTLAGSNGSPANPLLVAPVAGPGGQTSTQWHVSAEQFWSLGTCSWHGELPRLPRLPRSQRGCMASALQNLTEDNSLPGQAGGYVGAERLGFSAPIKPSCVRSSMRRRRLALASEQLPRATALCASSPVIMSSQVFRDDAMAMAVALLSLPLPLPHRPHTASHNVEAAINQTTVAGVGPGICLSRKTRVLRR